MSENVDHARAAHALKQVQKLVTNQTDYGNYVSFVKSMPPTILQIGLGQVLAYEFASASANENATARGHETLHKHLCNWLGRDEEDAPYYQQPCDIDLTNTKRFIEALMSGDEGRYLHAQAEALAYLSWLKKFAVAFLVEPEKQQEGADS